MLGMLLYVQRFCLLTRYASSKTMCTTDLVDQTLPPLTSFCTAPHFHGCIFKAPSMLSCECGMISRAVESLICWKPKYLLQSTVALPDHQFFVYVHCIYITHITSAHSPTHGPSMSSIVTTWHLYGGSGGCGFLKFCIYTYCICN